MLDPEFIVCDEPVSALDVSIQSQILNLLLDLRRDFGLTYLFVAHNLSVVQYLSDRVGVMYLGKMVELGPVDEIYADPQASLHGRPPVGRAGARSASPVQAPGAQGRRAVTGRATVRAAASIPAAGCASSWATPRPATPIEPEFRDLGDGHLVACHFSDKIGGETLRDAVAAQAEFAPADAIDDDGEAVDSELLADANAHNIKA